MTRRRSRLNQWIIDRETLPRGWHSYDPKCGCASCEAGGDPSPYLKVKRRRTEQ